MTLRLPVVVVCAALAAVVQSAVAADPVIWVTGVNDVTFSLNGTQDTTMSQFWDVLSTKVAITRGPVRGVFNPIADPIPETSYTHNVSPIGTLWAFSDLNGSPTFNYGAGAAIHSDLVFSNWEASLGGSTLLKANIDNRPGVIFLQDDNAYLDVIFTSWTTGGAMSYTRATPPPSVINAAWNGGSGNWSNPANWSSNPKYPSNGTNGTFTAAINTGNVTLDVDATVNNLTLGGTTGNWTAQLNLANRALVIAATSANKASIISTLLNQLATGKTNNYTGNGITSSAVASNATTMSIALADNSNLALTSFRGQSLNADSLILVAAHNGDASLDNKVDALDLNVLAAHWQQQSGALWSIGDFNGDGKVDALDLNVLAANWQFGSGGGGSLEAALAQFPQFSGVSVPEPGSIGFMALAVSLLVRRGKRSHG